MSTERPSLERFTTFAIYNSLGERLLSILQNIFIICWPFLCSESFICIQSLFGLCSGMAAVDAPLQLPVTSFLRRDSFVFLWIGKHEHSIFCFSNICHHNHNSMLYSSVLSLWCPFIAIFLSHSNVFFHFCIQLGTFHRKSILPCSVKDFQSFLFAQHFRLVLLTIVTLRYDDPFHLPAPFCRISQALHERQGKGPPFSKGEENVSPFFLFIICLLMKWEKAGKMEGR